jgi:hypothetical protein
MTFVPNVTAVFKKVHSASIFCAEFLTKIGNSAIRNMKMLQPLAINVGLTIDLIFAMVQLARCKKQLWLADEYILPSRSRPKSCRSNRERDSSINCD